MSLSAKLRFATFARDGFTCMYCGSRPPDVALEVDHYLALARGGTDDMWNLLTACEPCNKGKGGTWIGDPCPTCVRPGCGAFRRGRDDAEHACACDCHPCPFCDRGGCPGRNDRLKCPEFKPRCPEGPA